jgi:hypothetical protein
MGAPRITIDASLSREGLLELRAAIDVLLGGEAAEPSPYLMEARERMAERKVREIWSRVGDNIRQLLTTAAMGWPEGEEFTMEDLSVHMRTPAKTVRSLHRNLGRTLHAMESEYPEPPMMISRWNGQRNAYRLPVEVRRAILEINDEYL